VSAEGIHKDDVGTRFVVTVMKGGVAFDFTATGGTVSTKQILLKQPDGDVLTKTALYDNDTGSDGKLLYVTIADDLSQAGRWEIQAYIVVTGGDNAGMWHTDKVEFSVLDNVE